VGMASTLVKEELEDEEDTQKDKFLIFTLGKEFYGIEISNVTEIIGIQPITEVPELPEYIRGIMNLRGKIIPVMDVRMRFKKPFIEYNDRTCVVVIDINDISIGLIVDSVSEVTVIPNSDIVEPPEINNISNKFIKGIGKIGNEVKLLLDCNQILDEDDNENLSNL
jgi:purine-binding chemotaxis protein CheW